MKPICLREGNNFGKLHRKIELDYFWVSLTSYGAKDTYEKHYHENPYLSLLIKGSYTETNKKSTELLNSGEIIFRPALYDHSNKFCGKPGTCFNIEFKKEKFNEMDLSFNLPLKQSVYKCGDFPTLYKSFVDFIKDDSDISEHLFNWLHEVNDTKIRGNNTVWITKVKTILETETDLQHSLKSLSERVFVHPVYLAGCFKKKMGITVGEYQLRSKLKQAAYLLFNTQLSINDIAIKCGFYDAPHFIRHYTETYGISPNQFRAKLKA